MNTTPFERRLCPNGAESSPERKLKTKEVESVNHQNQKLILNLNEAAEMLGVDVDCIKDFIQCGDLPAVGSNKNFIKLYDIHKFMGIEPATSQNQERPVDFSGNQRYPLSHSIQIEDISEREWCMMKQKEHTQYFNQQKGKWCIALSLGKNEEGKRIRKIISGETQAEVWDAYQEYLKQQNEVAPICQDTPIVKEGLAEKLHIQTYAPNQDVLVSECYAKYLKGLESGIVNRTYGGYVTTSRLIVEKLGHLKMYELNREVIQQFFNDLQNTTYTTGKNKRRTQYYSQSSLNKIFDLLHKFILEYSNDCIRDAILPKDYMANMEKPRSKALKSSGIKPYKPEEIQNVFGILEKDRMILCWVHIMAELGCRPSEALALTWEDIDFENHMIHFCKALGKEADFDPVTHKRTSAFKPIIKDLKNERGRNHRGENHCRELQASAQLMGLLNAWRQEVKHSELGKKRREYGTEQFVFTGRNGDLRIYEDYTQRYNRLLKSAGLNPSEMNPYRYRHTVCTDLLRHKVDLKTVQLIMGDSTSDVILDVYANIQKEDMIKASTKLSERMASILNNGQTVAN